MAHQDSSGLDGQEDARRGHAGAGRDTTRIMAAGHTIDEPASRVTEAGWTVDVDALS
jgi:hypothetical protein